MTDSSGGSEDREPAKFREFLASAAIRGSVELRGALAITETEYQRVAPTEFANTRDYFLYAICDDLVGVGSALDSWVGLCEPPADSKASDALDRSTYRRIVVEQRTWARKLMEALVDVICFEQANDDAYFRHALLIAELARATYRQLDRFEFYGRRLENLDERIAMLETDLREAEKTVDLARAFYRNNDHPLPRNIDAKRLESSFRKRFKLALTICRPSERLLLGQTYALYSQQSASIHFSPQASRHEDWRQIPGLFTHVGLLACMLLVRAARLAKVALGDDRPMLAQLERTFGSAGPDATTTALLGRTLAVGEYVHAYGMLVRIDEVHVSDFGYEAYRVRIIDGDGSTGKSDWLIRTELHPFVETSLVESKTRALLSAHGSTPDPAVLSAAVEESVIAAWRTLKTRTRSE